MSIRVAVLGACGKMGRTVCEAVSDDPGLELAACVDPGGVGEQVRGVPCVASVEELSAGDVDVAVDFTHAEGARQAIPVCLQRGIHCVTGTTGIPAEELEDWAASGRASLFVAPNFSIGAVLMMHLSRQAARYLGSCEIVELHHNQKLDAPSGTALKTAREIAAAWAEHGRPPGGDAAAGEREVVAGARGADVDGVRVHSVRGQGLVAHQEVIFGGPGQTLTIRHDAPDRLSYMPGVLLAVKRVADLPPLTIGLEHLLDLA